MTPRKPAGTARIVTNPSDLQTLSIAELELLHDAWEAAGDALAATVRRAGDRHDRASELVRCATEQFDWGMEAVMEEMNGRQLVSYDELLATLRVMVPFVLRGDSVEEAHQKLASLLLRYTVAMARA